MRIPAAVALITLFAMSSAQAADAFYWRFRPTVVQPPTSSVNESAGDGSYGAGDMGDGLQPPNSRSDDESAGADDMGD